MKFYDLVRDTRVRRKLLLALYAILLLAALLSIALVSQLLLMSKANPTDKFAEIGDVITGGTAVLAVIAGLVALQAYSAATGLPNVEIQVWFFTSAKNLPVFYVTELHPGFFETTSPPNQTVAMISLRNRSSYSARDPVIILKLSSVSFDSGSGFPSGEEWTVFELPDDPASGEVVIQWEGGATSAIHGHSWRRLPNLQFGAISYDRTWQPPIMKIEIAADGGYHRGTDIPLSFVLDDGSLVGGAAAADEKAEWL